MIILIIPSSCSSLQILLGSLSAVCRPSRDRNRFDTFAENEPLNLLLVLRCGENIILVILTFSAMLSFPLGRHLFTVELIVDCLIAAKSL